MVLMVVVVVVVGVVVVVVVVIMMRMRMKEVLGTENNLQGLPLETMAPTLFGCCLR